MGWSPYFSLVNVTIVTSSTLNYLATPFFVCLTSSRSIAKRKIGNWMDVQLVKTNSFFLSLALKYPSGLLKVIQGDPSKN